VVRNFFGFAYSHIDICVLYPEFRLTTIHIR